MLNSHSRRTKPIRLPMVAAASRWVRCCRAQPSSITLNTAEVGLR